MEAVSFAAAILALTKVVTGTVRAIDFYSSALKNALELELPRVKQEIEDLQAVLKNLELLAQKGDCSETGTASALPTLKAIRVGEKLALYEKELRNLSSRLNLGSRDDSKTKKLVQQLRWPLQKKETEQLILAIRGYTQSLVQALQTDQVFIALDMNNNMMGQQRSDTVRRNDTLHQNIARWLSAIDPLSNHRQAKSKWHPNTALWFTQSKHFEWWMAGAPAFCWLHGILGCGKTVMSCAVIEHLRHHLKFKPASALAYFYFDFSDPDKMTPDGMVRSLIKQFLHQCDTLPQRLVSLYEKSRSGNYEPEPSEFRTILRYFIDLFDESFIVLDALDECSDASAVLHIINDVLDNRFSKAHFLATSRKTRIIEEGVDSLQGRIQKVPMDIEKVNADIRVFVHECLQTDSRFKRWKNYPDIQEEIKTKTTNKSDGMFQWAVCQLEILGNCAHTATVHETLASSPMSLNAIYERILRAIDLKWRNYAAKVLQWLAFSARPLAIAELAEMFTINLDGHPQFDSKRKLFDPREILDMCSPLVIIDGAEGGNEVVRLSHFSVKELIMSNYLSTGSLSHYHISEKSANVEMVNICLAYLLHVGIQTTVNDEILKQFPLARYAARYWIHHLRTADTSTSIIRTLATKLLSFDSLVYLNWIRLCDPERPRDAPKYTRKRGSIPPPLYYMALTGLDSMTELLLEDGNNGNDSNISFYQSPLQAASAMGHTRVVKQLLEKGADDTLKKGGEWNPLRLATVGGHLEVVELLFNYATDIHIPSTLLPEAASRGHIDIVKLLLRRGCDPNVQDRVDGTALQSACTYGYDQIVFLLLENGADVNMRGGLNGGPLQAASSKGNLLICKHLLSKGADPNSKGGEWCSALKAASAHGHVEIVDELLKNSAVIDMVDGEGGSSLQAALARGHETVSHLLLCRGANHAWKGGIYDNVLQAASLGGVLSVVKHLVNRYDADVNTVGGKFGTALQAAASNGHVEVVEFLIDRGAKIDIPGGHYGSALLAASSKGRAEVVQVLLTHGAEANAMVDGFGFAIQEAAAHNRARVVRLLLENGANVNCTGGRRGLQNILELATRRGYLKVVCTILEWADKARVRLDGLEAAKVAAKECGRYEISSKLSWLDPPEEMKPYLRSSNRFEVPGFGSD
ncbi:hypothetical protein AJ78_07924 [Emergomyces pasteurianus Ep9510]|uniref:Uncharacterized protein n=1 Tax=Emergomyces pasteurianus Ep9510 TaxID=1447872 RepID=A0A1J9Q4T9_9EURO|nr:hypothetical protein AJ78_07924 [Emergomyces pasteurianus Ep9510]